jgi:hypothetical protein
MPADRQPATGASPQPVVEMNIPITQTTVDVTTSHVNNHPDPVEYLAEGFFYDLEIL